MHLAWNLAWLVAGPVLLVVTLPFNKWGSVGIVSFLWHVAQYYLLLGLLALTRRNWEGEYPHLAAWLAAASAVIVTVWFFGLYVHKVEQERRAYYAYLARRGPGRSVVLDDERSDEAYNLGEDWKAVRGILPWYLAAALVGLAMAIVSLFSLDCFINPFVETVSSWNKYVLAVPLLPTLLALVGLIMAVSFLFKGVVLISAQVALRWSLMRRHREETET